MTWCTHCQKICKVECYGSFASCSTCGKVFPRISGRKKSTLLKKSSKKIKKKRYKNAQVQYHGSSSLITSFHECKIVDGFHEGLAPVKPSHELEQLPFMEVDTYVGNNGAEI